MIKQINISNLVPHNSDMLLLDEVIDFGDDWLIAKTTIKADNIFIIDNQVSAIIGIELIAQTVAAFAGKIEYDKGLKCRIGLLLGTRSYTSNINNFQVGDELTIKVVQDYRDSEGLAIFKGEITGKLANIVATINVYYPEKINYE